MENNMKQFNLQEYLANPSRQVMTRDGSKVRIVCTDFDNPDFPVVGEINCHKWPISFTTDGKSIKGRQLCTDLFFAPEKREGWVKVYKNLTTGRTYCDCNIYASKEEAKKQHGNAIAKIEWEEE